MTIYVFLPLLMYLTCWVHFVSLQIVKNINTVLGQLGRLYMHVHAYL
jgi:hypothetical protein